VTSLPKTIDSPLDVNLIRGDIFGDYIFGADVDLGGVEWSPIKEFYGTIDGNGYTLKNFAIYNKQNSSTSNIGFVAKNFGQIFDLTFSDVRLLQDQNSWQIRNLAFVAGVNVGELCGITVSNFDIIISNSRALVATIASSNQGTIKDCIVMNGSIIVFGSFGGVANENQGTIQNARVTVLTIVFAYMTNGKSVGGVAAFNDLQGVIKDCYFEGTIVSPSAIDTDNTNQQFDIDGYTNIGFVVGYNIGQYYNINSSGTQQINLKNAIYKRFLFSNYNQMIGRVDGINVGSV